MARTDIVIIGAGPAGLCFARHMADTGLNIVLVEKQSAQLLSSPPYDGREIALTHFSKRVMEQLGIWPLLTDEGAVSRIRDAKVLNGSSPIALSFDHDEAGVDNLGFMVSNNAIRRTAYRALNGCETVRIADNCTVTAIGSDADKGWVTLDNGERLEAELIVAADSRFSATRRMMGISADMLDFGRTCIVCTMAVERAHDATAYECFHNEQTLAILPLDDKRVSVVVTIGSEQARTILDMSAAAFAVDIERRFNHRFGVMTLDSERYSYPLVATFAKSFHANRFAVIGDAAVGMHPVTAHGFNLGLRGSDILAREIKQGIKTGQDFSGPAILERYSREHRRNCAPLYHGTNALVRLYTKQTPLAKLARHALLRIAKRLPPARHLIMNQLTENGPYVPRPKLPSGPRRLIGARHGR